MFVIGFNKPRLFFILLFVFLFDTTRGQLVEWKKEINYTTLHVPYNAYLAPTGKSIGVGYYADSIKIGSDVILNKGKQKFYVTQFGPNGQAIKTFADGTMNINASLSLWEVLYDRMGNIILTGSFSTANPDSIRFGSISYPSISNGTCFLARYSSSGNLLGAPIFYKNGFIEKIAVDQDNALYCTGYFQDRLDLKDTLLIGTGYLNSFLVKYDDKGKVAWAKTLRSKNNNYSSSGGSVLIDKWNSLYWIGHFIGTLEEEGRELTSIPNSGENMYIASYDNKGKLNWIKRDGSNTFRPKHMLLVKDSLLLLSGFFQGPSTQLGDTLLMNAPDTASMMPTSYFLATYNTRGQYRWSKVVLSPIQQKRMFPSDYGDVIDIAYDGRHTFWLTGRTVGNVNVMGTSFFSNPDRVNGFLASCDLTGKNTHVWQPEGLNGVTPYCLNVDSCGSIYVMGQHNNSAFFDSLTTNVPSSSYVLAKYSPPTCQLTTANHDKVFLAEDKATLYPIPAKNSLSVDWSENNEQIELVILDMKGQKVKEYQEMGPRLVLDISGFVPGVYTVKMSSGRQTKILRLLKE